ncbi:hypothetical protein B0T26DRAFT_648852 [Lasiosphaeria miniovina]|uniref:SET domain-containing protein n=1 Tax=Lasiosphaeria miniovina TaxID=1954250 RepID=A0AA40DQZ2_9PEZI|nr:uncharacterized protein B0T26DRAFT_648852 [Lasiosphaeria miniovina]KAK0712909.1 hypothetical protein B0T26DRAFT_648852 [Lasiosphaeria miniovina]
MFIPAPAALRYAVIFALLAQAQAHAAAPAQHQKCPSSTPVALRQDAASAEGACRLPVDDEAGPLPLSWSPWTHRPDCIYGRSGAGTKYCAFSNSRHGARGVSIVTTPETAADVLGMLDQHVGTTEPLADNSSTTGRQRQAAFRIVDVPGKGKGVVAARRIAQHDEVMLDYAALLVHMAFATDVPAWTGYRVLHTAAAQLADPASVLGLGQSSGQAADPLENVLRTNAFHTSLGGQPHMALYPLVSRINHACKPNAYTRFIPQSIQVSVGAARDIEAGEEITISYITLGQTSAERHKALQQWGFNCTCALCTAGADVVAASDARRRQVDALRGQAVEAFQRGKPYEALRLTRQVLGLLPAEELFPLYSEQYENIARIYWVLQDMERAEENARLSLDVLARQGYIDSVTPGHLDMLWRQFERERTEEQ